jgi:hypothetical protein
MSALELEGDVALELEEGDVALGLEGDIVDWAKADEIIRPLTAVVISSFFSIRYLHVVVSGERFPASRGINPSRTPTRDPLCAFRKFPRLSAISYVH